MATTEQSEEQTARMGATPVADPSAPASPAAPPESATASPVATPEPAPLPARRARRVVLATPPPALAPEPPPAPVLPADPAQAAAVEAAPEPPAAGATRARPPMQAWTPPAAPEKRTAGRNGGAPTNGKAALAPPSDIAGRPRRVVAEAPAVKPAPAVAGAATDQALPDEAPASGGAAVWRSRGLILGLLAIGLALYGQQLVWVDHAVIPSIHWYTLAIAVMLLAWLGTYKNKSFLRLPGRRAADTTLPSAPGRGARFAALRERGSLILAGRYLLAFVALALNLFSVSELRADYYSPVGGWGWLLSLILLVVAFIGDRPRSGRDADARAVDVEDRTALRLPIRLEIVIALAIFALAFAIRVYRLDDWTGGVHGDEGEAGMDALSIYQGHLVSPFLSGWFGQLNFYYWGIALLMKVFGTGLGGVRAFAMLVGAITVIPFYLMVRDWFGVRMAIIAATLLAVSDVAISFARQELSTITTPLFLVTGFLFLFRGLRTRRPLDFVWAGFAFMLNPFFYFGGRIAPIILGGVVAYLFLLMPVVRVPGAYLALRRRLPTLGRGRALLEAAGAQARGVLYYFRQLLVLGIAALCCAMPWIVYSTDHSAEWNSRPLEKLIFNQPQAMAQQHGATHDPLYIGLRLPTPNDVYPFLPVVFEHTPISLQIAPDGFWPRALWGQLTTTLSILTYRGDASSFYTFTQEPAAKPIEAALIILGLAWAVWRWRDSRMGALSIWFWAIVLSGGVLTIDAPYMPRILGIIPVMAVCAALPLSKLSAELIHVAGQFGRRLRPMRVAQVVTAGALAVLLIGLGLENFNDYYTRYLSGHPFNEVTGQAYFVRQMTEQAAAAGRPSPRFYDLGIHMIYWGHGVNRFLNYQADGSDMTNPANELPVLDDKNRDVYFMVWGLNQQYLDVLKAYYPEGVAEPFSFAAPPGQNVLFTAFHVTREQLAAHRVVRATYTPASGPAITRDEPHLGTGSAPPLGLAYPAQGAWHGEVVAPAFSRYRFQITGGSDAQLMIDGAPIVTTTTSGATEIILARGPHEVDLSATLPSADARVEVQWAGAGQALSPVGAAFLWSGPGRGLLGEVRLLSGDPFGPLPPDTPNTAGPGAVVLRRVDGFLGFRHSPDALSNGAALMAAWTGSFTATQAGPYQFEMNTNGDSTLSVDGKLVVDNRSGARDTHNASGGVTLTPGAHTVEVRYTWMSGTGIMEVFWTPPNGARTMFGPEGLQTTGGAWRPGTISPPTNVGPQTAQAPPVVPPAAVFSAKLGLKEARGLAVAANGAIFVGDTGNNRVLRLGTDGQPQTTWGKAAPKPGSGVFNTLGDVAVTPDGHIVTMDSASGDVEIFTPDGHSVRYLPGMAPQANGIAVGPDGRIWIAHTGGNRVLVLSPDGQVADQLFGGEPGTRQRFEQPVDVAVAPNGTVYVIDLKARIAQLDAAGAVAREWPVEIGVARGGSRLAIWQGKVVMTDPDRGRLVILDPATGEERLAGVPGSDAGQFALPLGVAAGPDGRLYVLDSDNSRVQVFGGDLLNR